MIDRTNAGEHPSRNAPGIAAAHVKKRDVRSGRTGLSSLPSHPLHRWQTPDGFLDLALAQASTSDLSLYLNLSSPPSSQDCDANGIPDVCDIASEATRDYDSNGVQDQCDRPRFHRGDPNSSGTTDISDAVAIFGFLFLGDAAPACKESADVQNDGKLDILDGIYYILN